MRTHLYLGFDPGGRGNFGWCILSGTNPPLHIIATDVANNAKDALEQTCNRLNGKKPCAVGIDAPLFWCSDGGRDVDDILRKMVIICGGHGGTVNPVNSLQGACSIQGMMTAMLLRDKFPGLKITESHPKAMLWILGIACDKMPLKKITFSNLGEFFGGKNLNRASEHERDAALGALSAWAMKNKPKSNGWTNLYTKEDNMIFFLKPSPEYWMPSADKLQR